MNRHNRIYTILLIVLAFWEVLSIISVEFVSHSPTMEQQSRWAMQMVACLEAAFLVAMVTTLILRGVAPGAGRIATKALNIILLLLLPLGTALGIYGLLKVDKDIAPTG